MEPCPNQQHNKKNLRRRPMDKHMDQQTKQSDGNSKRRRLQQMMLIRNSNNNNYKQRIISDDSRRIVADLNNKAVELYSKGDFHNASNLFEEATTSLHDFF